MGEKQKGKDGKKGEKERERKIFMISDQNFWSLNLLLEAFLSDR